jgi:hypothetical protein
MENFTHRSKRRTRGLIVLIVLGIVGGGAFLFVRGRQSAPRPAPEKASSSQYDLGAWEWRGPQKFSVDDLSSYMEFATSENISTIYLHVGEVIDINELPAAEKAKKLSDFNIAAKQFIQEAHRHGIDVHALAGSVQWAEPDYQYLPLQIMDYVAAYNKSVTLEERLDGVQFDIETYNKKDFDDDKQKALHDLLTTVARIQSRLNDIHRTEPTVALGFAVPYWFDNQNNNLPDVTYNFTSKPVVQHIFDILNASTHGYLAIMDYRDHAGGKNGSISQAEDEIRYAETAAKNVQVVIGQLVSDTKPLSTTFYDDSPDHMYGQFALLQKRFESSPNYAGLALHDVKTFKKFVKATSKTTDEETPTN